MPKINQKGLPAGQAGVAHLLLLLILLAGITTATFLVQQETNFLPKAQEPNDAPDDTNTVTEDGFQGLGDSNNNGLPDSLEAQMEGDKAVADAIAGLPDYEGSAAQASDIMNSTYHDLETLSGAYDAALAGGNIDLANQLAEQYEAKNGEYREAAAVFDSLNSASAVQAEGAVGAIESVKNGVTVEDVFAANPNLDVSERAAVMGSVRGITPEQARDAAVEYAVSRGYEPHVSAGMGAIAAQIAGGNKEQIMEAAMIGEFSRSNQASSSVAYAIGTGQYLNLDPTEIASTAIGIAQSRGLTAEQFGTGAAGLQMSSAELQSLWDSVAATRTGGQQAVAVRDAAREAEVAGILDSARAPLEGQQRPAEAAPVIDTQTVNPAVKDMEVTKEVPEGNQTITTYDYHRGAVDLSLTVNVDRGNPGTKPGDQFGPGVTFNVNGEELEVGKVPGIVPEAGKFENAREAVDWATQNGVSLPGLNTK